MTTRPAHLMLLSAAALAAASWIAVLDARAAQMKNASEGVYTEAQATRGRDLYDSSCASCHELSKFKGPEFMKAWSDKPMAELHTAVMSMPMDAPGSMSAQEYADIIAYFLNINGYKAGAAELAGTEDAIKAIKIDAKQ
ncbi:MAG: c-type cytochrome [Vicinamibacterales bacterium]